MTAGETLGRFELKRRLNQGGPGMAASEVFLARDTRRNEEVILKLIATTVEDQDALEAEKRGAELQQQLGRVLSDVARVYEYGILNEHFYVEMEVVAGRDLNQVLAEEGGRLEAQRAARITRRLCDLLEVCHHFQGALAGERITAVLHCDLKPENLRLTDGDEVKILDFGTATYLTPTHKFAEVSFGSPPYTSPERLKGDGKVDALADLWAVGVLLYLIVSGREPFTARDEEEQKEAIISGNVLPLSNSVDPRLAPIIQRSLAKDPADRYLTARAFRDDLTAYLEGRPLAPTPIRASSKTQRTARSRTGAMGADSAPPPRSEPGPPPPPTPASNTPLAPASRMGGRKLGCGLMLALAVVVAGCQVKVHLEAKKLLRDARSLAKPRLDDLPRVDQLLSRRERVAAWGPLGLSRTELTEAVCVAGLRGVHAVIDAYWDDTRTGNLERWILAQSVLHDALQLRPTCEREAGYSTDDIRGWEWYLAGQAWRLQAVKYEKDGGSPQDVESARQKAIDSFQGALGQKPCWLHPFRALFLLYGYDEFNFEQLLATEAAAQGCGITLTKTEQAAVADGMFKQASLEYDAAKGAWGASNESALLILARDRFTAARQRFAGLGRFGNAQKTGAECSRHLKQIETRLDELMVQDLIRGLGGES